MNADRRRTAAAVGGALAVAYAAGSVLLPKGLPVEVLIPGVVTGALAALSAFGLVLVFRAARVINFAQANIAGLATTLTVLLVGVEQWSYWLAVPAGLMFAALLGTWIERGLLGRLREAPRLIVTVATIGVAQLLGGLTLYISGTPLSVFGWRIPQIFHVPTRIAGVVPFRLPWHAHLTVGSLQLTPDYLAAALLIPAVLVALGWFFNRTDAGIGARAIADSSERALLLGIPVRRLSLLTWVVASVLGALGGILQAGVHGFQASVPAGPESLVLPLAAAVIGGFESLSVTFAAAVALGLVQQALFWSYVDPSLNDLTLFVVTLGALMLRRRTTSRVGGSDGGGSTGVGEVRPLPALVAQLPQVRIGKRLGGLVLLLAVGAGPLAMNSSQLSFAAFITIFVIVAASLLILAGWGGQVSLGQFGFVGIGAGVTAWLLQTHHASLILCLTASIVAGTLAALVIGLPALRIRGLYLAVATLAFATPASTYFLSPQRFPELTPIRIDPPLLFGRFDVGQPRTFYYLCLLLSLAALAVVRNFRLSRIGRAAIAVRDNERFAAASSLSDTRIRLATFATSGALAGLAGGLYVLALRGVPFGGFAPVLSLEAFTMIVVGGMGSVWGAVLGAIYLYGAQYFLGATAQLLTTGGGIVLVLTFAPGGLADLGYRLRDRLLGLLLRRKGLSENAIYSRADSTSETPQRDSVTRAAVEGLLHVEQVEAGYGHLQILFGVDLAVQDEEVFALLGTNGAGKSTILKVIAGLLPARSGRVVFRGEDLSGLTPAERVSRGLVLVPGGRGVFANLTVAENLRLAGWLARRRKEADFLRETEEQVYRLFPVLRERADQRAGLLSGGEQQMLTIAQALMCRPQLLMIDELSLGLAPSVVADLLAVIRELSAGGMTMIIVEQSTTLAASIAPHAVFLEKGEVRFRGPTAELTDDKTLVRAVFLSGTPATTRERVPQPMSQDAPTVLQVSGLTKSYGGVRAVQGVDLSFAEGQIVGVIGANGAGKTTLFDLICGFVRPDSGQVLLHGEDVTARPAADRFDLGLGRTFQDLRLVPSLTVAELLAVAHERHIEVRDPFATIVALPAALRSEALLRHQVEELIEAFNLQRYANSFVSELSTGTRRIVELAAATAHRPRVLVLDEPSSGLAQSEAEALVPRLLQVKEQLGATVAIIEHDIPMIRSLCDELVCMHLGGVLARGTAEEVLADPAVVSSYLGLDDAAIERGTHQTTRENTRMTTPKPQAPARTSRAS